MYDLGKMKDISPEVLYTFACSLEDLPCVWDTDSDAYRVFRQLVNDVWEIVPKVITIDLRSPDEVYSG